MNKAELIAAVAEKAGLSKKDTEAVITATLNTITAALRDEEARRPHGSEPPHEGARRDCRDAGSRLQGR